MKIYFSDCRTLHITIGHLGRFANAQEKKVNKKLETTFFFNSDFILTKTVHTHKMMLLSTIVDLVNPFKEDFVHL